MPNYQALLLLGNESSAIRALGHPAEPLVASALEGKLLREEALLLIVQGMLLVGSSVWGEGEGWRSNMDMSE